MKDLTAEAVLRSGERQLTMCAPGLPGRNKRQANFLSGVVLKEKKRPERTTNKEREGEAISERRNSSSIY